MEGSIEPQDTKNINRPVAPPRRKKSKVPSINVSPHNDSTAVPASSSPNIGPASPPHVVDTSRSTSPGSPVLPKRPPAPRPRSKISVSNSRQESSLNTSIGSDSNARSQPEAVLSDGRKVSTAGGRHPKLKRQISGPKPVITPRVMTSARTDIKGQNEGEPQTVSLTSFAANTKRPDRKAFTMNNKSSTSSYSTSEEELSPNKESSSLSSVPSVKKDQRTVSVELQKSSVSSFCTMPRRLTNDKQRSGHKTTSSVKKDKEDKSPERSSTTVIYTKGNRKSYVSVNHSKPNQYQHAPVHRDTLADSYTHEPKVDRAKKKGSDSPVLKSRPTQATNSPKTSLSRQNKVTDTPEVHRKQSKYPPRVNTNVHQQTRPPKDPYINLSQGKKKPLGRGVKPVRPAPPPPNMIAHYAQFKPHSVPSEKTFPEDDTYSYVLVTPRYRLEQPGSRNLHSLNLEVSSRQRVNSFDTYVNEDMHMGLLQTAAKEDTYMPLSDATLLVTKDDIYTVPSMASHAHHILSLQGDFPDSPTYVSGEHDDDKSGIYMIPDDAHCPDPCDPDNPVEEDTYMALTDSTLEESSIYQAPSASLVQSYSH